MLIRTDRDRERETERDKERRALSETDKDQGPKGHSDREGRATDGDPERDKLQEKKPGEFSGERDQEVGQGESH